MASPIPNQTYPPVGTKAAEHLLWQYPGVTIEFTHSHKAKDDLQINNGNIAPHHGFGHIAFNINSENMHKLRSDLNEHNVRTEEDFVFDPDGYYIKLCQVENGNDLCNLSQTMLRIKDPTKSLAFYCDIVGMKKVYESHDEDQRQSVYYLSSHVTNENVGNWKEFFHPLLKLTHFWDTERGHKYHNGNTEPKGFGHIGFLVNDLDGMVPYLQGRHVTFHKIENQGFAFDPDGYWVEFIQKGTTIDTGDGKKEKKGLRNVDKLWDKAKMWVMS